MIPYNNSMFLGNTTKLAILIVSVGFIITTNFFLSSNASNLFSKVLATFNETQKQNNNDDKISQLKTSNESSIVLVPKEDCEDKLPPNPRLGWTNPRIPIDPDPKLECVPTAVLPTTAVFNSTTDH
ncbi:hypothetical protein BH23THE1_BH23THE1_35320 [soil metagenome]